MAIMGKWVMVNNGNDGIMDNRVNEDDGDVEQWGIMGHNGNNGIMDNGWKWDKGDVRQWCIMVYNGIMCNGIMVMGIVIFANNRK